MENTMHLLSRSVSTARLALAAALTGAALSGCYVVPLGQPLPQQPVSPPYAVAPTPITQTFNARLYPSNAEAASYGMINGIVTSDMNGRGHISAQINGEQFQGDATRAANSRSGVANAAGSRGGMLACRYTMNSSTLGSGQCVLNDGPMFAMHIGG
jgi:hypothetical protein